MTWAKGDSYERLMNVVQYAAWREFDRPGVFDAFGNPVDPGFCTVVLGTFPDAIVFEDVNSELLYEATYVLSGDTVVFGQPVEVQEMYAAKRMAELGMDLQLVEKQETTELELAGPIVKKSADDLQIAYAAVLVPGEPDSDGEVLTAEKIEDAAHGWMESYRNVDLMHTLNNTGVPVESYILPDALKVEAYGNPMELPAGTWILASKLSDEAWAGVKSGELTGYSVMGIKKAHLESAVKSEEEVLDDAAFKRTLLADLGADWVAAFVSVVDHPAVPKAKFFALKSQEYSDLEAAADTSPNGPRIMEKLGKALGLVKDTSPAVEGALAEYRKISPDELKGIPDHDFAGANRSFPISKPADVAAAAASIGRAGSDNYSTEQIKANIISIANRKGPAFVAKLPAAWQSTSDKSNNEVVVDSAQKAGRRYSDKTYDTLKTAHEALAALVADAESERAVSDKDCASGSNEKDATKSEDISEGLVTNMNVEDVKRLIAEAVKAAVAPAEESPEVSKAAAADTDEGNESKQNAAMESIFRIVGHLKALDKDVGAKSGTDPDEGSEAEEDALMKQLDTAVQSYMSADAPAGKSEDDVTVESAEKDEEASSEKAETAEDEPVVEKSEEEPVVEKSEEEPVVEEAAKAAKGEEEPIVEKSEDEVPVVEKSEEAPVVDTTAEEIAALKAAVAVAKEQAVEYTAFKAEMAEKVESMEKRLSRVATASKSLPNDGGGESEEPVVDFGRDAFGRRIR